MDGNVVDGELEPSLSGTTLGPLAPPNPAAFAHEGAKMFIATNGACKFSKHSATWRLLLGIRKAAVSAKLKMLAAAAAIVCLYWACAGVPTIPSAVTPASAMGEISFADFHRSCSFERVNFDEMPIRIAATLRSCHHATSSRSAARKNPVVTSIARRVQNRR